MSTGALGKLSGGQPMTGLRPPGSIEPAGWTGLTPSGGGYGKTGGGNPLMGLLAGLGQQGGPMAGGLLGYNPMQRPLFTPPTPKGFPTGTVRPYFPTSFDPSKIVPKPKPVPPKKPGDGGPLDRRGGDKGRGT